MYVPILRQVFVLAKKPLHLEKLCLQGDFERSNPCSLFPIRVIFVILKVIISTLKINESAISKNFLHAFDGKRKSDCNCTMDIANLNGLTWPVQ